MRPALALALALSVGGCLPEDLTGTPVATNVCPSGLMWSFGDEGSTRMHPGSDCNSCHQREGAGPIYAGAGTVYVHDDESTGCFGVRDADVVLTFSDGTRRTARSNVAGNFWFLPEDGPFKPPFRVSVGYGGTGYTAEQLHTDMNCGSCHQPGSRIRLR